MKKRQFIFRCRNNKNHKLLLSKLGMIMLISILSISQVFAQGRKTISGKVTDSSNSGLPGVSIVIKGTSTGTISNSNGVYSLEVPANAKTLLFSFIGFKSEEININNQSIINVSMVEEAFGIDELVVVGYGTQKKATLTGAVTQVSGEDIMKGKSTSSAALALQGEVPGLVITRTSARPGNEGISIQIRGDISVNGVSPLILLDGLEIPDWQLSTINANDIETYSVLKDGAAAIYGTKAAGGVVLITTKKGKAGAPKITYNGQFQSNYAESYPVASFTDYAKMWLEGGDNGAVTYTNNLGVTLTQAANYRFFTRQNLEDIIAGTFPLSPTPYLWFTGKNVQFADVNNYDYMYGTTPSQRHDISISGGTDKVTYRTSLGYSDERSPISFVYDGAKKYNFRTNLSYKVSDMLKTDFNVSYDNRLVDEPTQGVGYGVHDMSAFPLYNPQGQFYDNFAANNPLALLSEGGRTKTDEQIFRLGGTITLDFNKYIKGLSLNYIGNMSQRNGLRTERKTSVTMYDWDGTVSSTPTTLLTSGVKLFESNVFFQNHVFQANYLHSFGKHNIGLMAGATAELQQTNQYFASRTNMADDKLDDINTGDVTTQITGGSTKQSNGSTFASGANAVGLVSYIGKVNYDYSGIFLIEGLGRRDGSSRFHPDYRWKNFFSASGGIRLSELGAIKDLGIFDNLKLRASYGETGSTSNIAAYDYLSNMTTTGTTLFGATPAWSPNGVIASMTSYDRTWERVENTNYAIDFTVLNNRLSGTAELYHRKNIGMLISVGYPQVLGATAPKTNSGDFTNDGLELTLNWKDKIGDLKYNVGFMYWDSRSEVTKMEGAINITYGQNTTPIEGRPLNSIYAYQTDGYLQNEAEVLDYYNQLSFVDPSDQLTLKTNSLLNAAAYRTANRLIPGSVRRVDVNGDGIITTADLVYQGDASAHNNFAINLGLEYKGFDFKAFFQGVGQQLIVRTGYLSYPFAAWYTQQNNTFIGKTWTPDYSNAPYPVMCYTASGTISNWNYKETNDINVINARYMRAKVLTLGYTLPKTIIAKAGIDRVRVSVTGNDLFVISNVKDGMDPEVSNSSSQGNALPYSKTLLFGIEVTF